MEYFYCKSWFRAKKVPTEIWRSDAAEAAHREGKPYTVLVNSPQRPTAFVEVTKDSVAVGFLDSNLRERLSYAFKVVKDREMFLCMATYREFQGDTDQVVSGSSYVFQEDGSVSIHHRTFSPLASEFADRVTDVSRNFTRYPAFGRYENVLRIELQ